MPRLLASPAFRETRRRAAASVLSAAVAAVALAGVGCDDRDADTAKVLADVERASNYRLATNLRSSDDASDYGKIAEDAAAVSDASPGAAAIANEMAGDALLERASILIASEGGLLSLQAEALQTASNMVRLANQIQTGNVNAQASRSAMSGFESVAADLRQNINALRTGQSWTVSTGEDSEISLPTVEQSQAQIEQLTAQIEQQKQTINDLNNRRDDAMATAGDQENEAANGSGESARNAARAVADAQTEAANIAAELAKAEAQLRRLEEQLAVEQARVEALEASATALEGQAQQIDDGVTSPDGLRTGIEELESTLSTLVRGTGAEGQPPSMAQLNDRLNQVLSEASDIRSQVVDATRAAETAFGNAARLAGEAANNSGSDPISRASSTAFRSRQAVDNLALASAKRQRAVAAMGEATVQAALLRLEATVQSAGDAIGSGDIDIGNPGSEFQRAVGEAAAALLDAEETAEAVTGTANGLDRAAAVERALIYSGMMTLRELVDATAEANPTAAEAGLDLPSMDELEGRLAEIKSSAESSNLDLPIIPRLNDLDPAAPADDAADEGEEEMDGDAAPDEATDGEDAADAAEEAMDDGTAEDE